MRFLSEVKDLPIDPLFRNRINFIKKAAIMFCSWNWNIFKGLKFSYKLENYNKLEISSKSQVCLFVFSWFFSTVLLLLFVFKTLWKLFHLRENLIFLINDSMVAMESHILPCVTANSPGLFYPAPFYSFTKFYKNLSVFRILSIFLSKLLNSIKTTGYGRLPCVNGNYHIFHEEKNMALKLPHLTVRFLNYFRLFSKTNPQICNLKKNWKN